ncbi:Conserved_hypothetical protein [Hexamita inflata]|uniref:Transmembrane protein n=1 Tax=Hexamita inflata TaxID=28002 RepID=A0AA86TTB6_9EUKA|nr:Conserved hypothetical protein [Hexamita inflata]
MQIISAIITEQVSIIATQLEFKNCYNVKTQALLFSANQSICVNLVSLNNSECNSFSSNVRVSVQLDAFSSLDPLYSPQTTIFNFSYQLTDSICIECLDPVCKSLSFQLSTKVQFRIETTSRFTECVCGKIERYEENRNECFFEDRINNPEFESKVILEQNGVCYLAAVNGKCSKMEEMVQTRATVNIYFNDSVQSYLYNVGDQNSFQIVQQVGTSGYFKYCFQDPGSLRFIMNRIPMYATLSIESTLDGILLHTVSQTKRVSIEETADGYYQTTAAIQMFEIQLFGLISNEQATYYNNVIKSIKNPQYFQYITIYSLKSGLSVSGYFNFSFIYMNNSVTYIPHDLNPHLDYIIPQMKQNEDLSALVIHWNTYVSDNQGNVIFALRKKINKIIVSCWTNISATWNSQTQLTITTTNAANLQYCSLIQPQNLSISLSQILDFEIPYILTPSFTMKIVNYSINQTQFVLTTTNQTLKQQIDTAFFSQFLIYDANGIQLENAEVYYWIPLIPEQISFQVKILVLCMAITAIYVLSLQYIRMKLYHNRLQLHKAEDKILAQVKV